MPAPSRLLVIGIDGADFAMISRWLGQGHLGHLQALCERGCLLPCHSTRPPLTAPAWTTALTGCNPGKHGIYEFLDLSYPTRRPFWLLPRGCPSVWRRVSDCGMSTGVFNVPATFPPEPVDGIMISGFGAPKPSFDWFYPRSLHDDFYRACPTHALRPPVLGRSEWPDTDTLLGFVRSQLRATRYLWSLREFDTFMVVFNSLDWAGHGYPGQEAEGEVLLTVAQEIDRAVGELVSQTDWPNTAVIIVSDHGMRLASRQINLPKLFVTLGLMKVRPANGSSSLRARGTSFGIKAYHRLKGMLPAPVVAWLQRVGHRQLDPLVATTPGLAIDWAGTIAAPLGSCGCVRLNVKKRDPMGIVAPEEYHEVQQEVARLLKSAQDPVTREPLFSRVFVRDELYQGPYLDAAPDLFVVARDESSTLGSAPTEYDLQLFMAQAGLVTNLVPPSGSHTETGILILSGNAIRAGSEPEPCNLADLAPTVLHLLGLPVPSYMDGRVLRAHMAGDAAARSPIILPEDLPEPQTPAVTYTPEQEAELLEKLRGLGYI